MKIIHYAALCCAFAAVLMGCSVAVPSSGNTWKLVSIAENTDVSNVVLKAMPHTVTITMTVNGTELGGFSGVNNYHGAYEVDGNVLKLGPFAVTMMAGPPEASEYERLYLQLLDSVTKIKEEPNKLILYNSKDKAVLSYDLFMLEGTTWELTAYNSGMAVVSVDPLIKAGIAFFPGGSLSGSTGVNNFIGSYTLKKSSSYLNVQASGLTRMASPNNEIAAFEQKFIALLGEVADYSISGRTLRLSDGAGVTLLSFQLK